VRVTHIRIEAMTTQWLVCIIGFGGVAICVILSRLCDYHKYMSRQRRRDRDRGRVSVTLLYEEYPYRHEVERAEFELVWRALAGTLGISPERLRHSDTVGSVVVHSKHYGVDSVDLQELAIDLVSGISTVEVVGMVFCPEDRTVSEIARDLLELRRRACERGSKV